MYAFAIKISDGVEEDRAAQIDDQAYQYLLDLDVDFGPVIHSSPVRQLRITSCCTLGSPSLAAIHPQVKKWRPILGSVFSSL